MTSRDYTLNDGTVLFRTARKNWRCCGGHDGRQRTRCDEPIVKGSQYVEYLGESPLYSSGDRYHLECARQQGLIFGKDSARKNDEE